MIGYLNKLKRNYFLTFLLTKKSFHIINNNLRRKLIIIN